MSTYLVDTNILARLVVRADPLRSVVKAAIGMLKAEAAVLRVAPQTIIELWAVATRSVEANGLGLSTRRAAEEVQSSFSLLDDPTRTFQRWRQLVQAHDVKGRQVRCAAGRHNDRERDRANSHFQHRRLPSLSWNHSS